MFRDGFACDPVGHEGLEHGEAVVGETRVHGDPVGDDRSLRHRFNQLPFDGHRSAVEQTASLARSMMFTTSWLAYNELTAPLPIHVMAFPNFAISARTESAFGEPGCLGETCFTNSRSEIRCLHARRFLLVPVRYSCSIRVMCFLPQSQSGLNAVLRLLPNGVSE